MQCRQSDNQKICNCPHICERKGICCLCLEHHRDKGELPACYFSDEAAATTDRSIETYLQEQAK
ncbi:hypothetical protein KJ840_00510 [Patescibacteria group bacterium]|nr:hypothetical protein [Patescibacteria group bacterium]